LRGRVLMDSGLAGKVVIVTGEPQHRGGNRH
jgi:hypothetical protein